MISIHKQIFDLCDVITEILLFGNGITFLFHTSLCVGGSSSNWQTKFFSRKKIVLNFHSLVWSKNNFSSSCELQRLLILGHSMQLHAEPLSTITCMIFIVVPDTIVSVTEVYLIILWSVTALCVVDIHLISDYVFSIWYCSICLCSMSHKSVLNGIMV